MGRTWDPLSSSVVLGNQQLLEEGNFGRGEITGTNVKDGEGLTHWWNGKRLQSAVSKEGSSRGSSTNSRDPDHRGPCATQV